MAKQKTTKRVVTKTQSLKEGVKVRKRKVPKKQLENPEHLIPTSDGIVRVTPENAQMFIAQQIYNLNVNLVNSNKLVRELMKDNNILIAK